MQSRPQLLIASIAFLGISTVFMPWLVYPKGNAIFPGYVGDGLLTGFVFFVIGITAIFSLKFNQLSRNWLVFWFIASGLNFYAGLYKIYTYEYVRPPADYSNPIIDTLSAGYYVGYGVYVLAIISFILCAYLLYYLWYNSALNRSKGTFSYKYLLLLVVLPLSVLVIYKYSTSTTDLVIEDSISEEVIQMGKALIEEDYETYTQFTHPIIIESMGGKQKLIDLLVSTKTQMLSEGSRIINIEPGQIFDVKNDGKTIQCLLAQNVTADKNGLTTTTSQKMIGISEDNGKNWTFINIGTKNKSEVKRIFPQLNMNLNL